MNFKVVLSYADLMDIKQQVIDSSAGIFVMLQTEDDADLYRRDCIIHNS